MKSRIQHLFFAMAVCLFKIPLVGATSIVHEKVSYSVQSDLLGCKATEGNAKKFTMKSKVILNKNFIPGNLDKKQLEDFYNDSIELQIKHFMGFFKNTKDKGLNAAIFAYRGPLSILKIDEVNYPVKLTIDQYLPTGRGNENKDYIKSALKVGHTDVTDKAVEISYSTELMLSDCSEGGFLRGPEISLPIDPYLSLWLENKSERSARILGPYKLNEASNCSSYEVAIFGTGDVSWFFWSPVTTHGLKACKIQDKNSLITPILTSVEVIPQAPKLSKDFFQKNKTFKLAAIFGEIDSSGEYFAKINYPSMRKLIAINLSQCINPTFVSECMTKWNPLVGVQSDKKYHEPGTASFLIFLKQLSTLVKISSFQMPENIEADKEIIIVIQGQLRDSDMPIQIDIHMGRTTLDYGAAATKAYVKFTHDAFKEADSIAYVGHAGMGANVSVGMFQKLWERDHLPRLERSAPLWMGLYNCEGVSYFGFDLNKIFKKNNVKVVETFTSGTISGPEFPLFHLLALNKIYSDKPVQIRDIIKIESTSREFLTETWLSEAQ